MTERDKTGEAHQNRPARARLVRALARLGLGRAARRLLGARAAEAMRDRLRWGRRTPGKPLPRGPRALAGSFGLNVVGYLRTESGLGEAARSTVRAARAAEVPAATTPVDADTGQRHGDLSFAGLAPGNPHFCNIIPVSAPHLAEALGRLGADFYFPRYNIGYWFWELAHFPESWQPGFGFVDEVWAASAFIQEGVARAAPVPVTRIPLGVEVTEIGDLPDEAKAIPSGRFVFLYVFDYHSVAERKNPLGALRAFQAAFPPGANAHLVLKTTPRQRDPDYHERLVRAARPGQVTIIDRYTDRAAINALLQRCDCYVSLHRCEGFGLTIAEAMYLGKPVIATAYSGNLDFTRPGNSYLAPCAVVEIDRDYGPYQKGWRWADPDLEAAGRLMRGVYERREEAARVGAEGARVIREEFSYAAVGGRMRERLRQLYDQLGLARTSA